MGMFDDLIPQATPSAGMFDDLIPDQPRRGRGARGERRLTDAGSPFDWEATGSGAVAQGETMFGGLLSAAGRNLEEYAERSGLGPAVEFVGQLTNNPAVEAARETVPEALVETGETFRDLGRVRQEQIQDRLIESPDSLLADPIESAKYGAQQLIMSGGPTVAGLGAAYVGAPVAGLGLMGALAGGQKFGDVYEETGDLARANEAAIASAAFETIPEVIPMALVSTKVAKLFGDDVAGYVTKLAQESPALKAALTSGAEGASEALTEVGNIAYESLREGREITGDDAWKRVRDAAFVGAGMGGVIAAPVAVQDTINNARQPEAADPVAAGIQAADEIFEQAAQDSQADVQPVTSAAQPAPQPAQDAEIDALLTPELDITPETESALDAAVTPPLGEPMSGGRVLFRGDPAEIRQKIADAGLRNAGGILQEDGEPVGVYFSASVADQVREVLGGSEASNIESASPSPDQAEPVVQQDQRVAGNRPPSTPVMEGVNNGVQSDTSGAGAPRRQADGNDGSRPSELGGVGDADQIGTAESVSAVGGNQNLAGSRPLDPDERSRADFESRLAKASEGLPPERVEQLRQLYQERPRDRVTGLYRSEDLTDTVDIAHAESATTPAVYIEMDFANLGGLNKRVGNSAADPFLKKAADVARTELEGAGATIGVRKGGDEFGFVVRGITQEQADAAMDRARAKFASDPDVAALADTPNPKAGRGPGIGIHYGTAQIDPDVPVADTIKAADTLVEARKDGAPYGRREREAAGSDRTVTRAAQGAPGAVEPRDGRVDSPAPRSSAAAEEQGSRLSDDTQLSWVDNKIGMAERGGHAIREFAGWEAPGEAAQGPVVARTTWHDPDAWGGEAGFWQSRPDPLTEAQARKALKKYREGKRLGSREQRFIDYAKSEAAFRDEQFESENAKYAEELRLQSDIDRQALFDELKAEVLSAGYNLDASEETEALTLFGWVDRAMSAGVPKAAIEAIDFTAPETDQVREFASLIREYSSESREAQGSGVGVDQDTGAPRAEEAAEPAEARTESDPLELEALTPEQATERAEAEQARQRQERNEQRAADRAEQRRREQAADRQQAADRNEDMAANFRLGQSDAEVRNEIAGQNDLLSPVDQAAAESAQSPENDLPEPTEAQKEAGNYKLGHVRISGMDVSIETPAGSSRRPEWPPLKHHYGYIKRTEGADGDHVDVFLGPKAEGDTPVFVVNQIDPKTGKFDEHKVMIGFDTEADARDGYAANYAKDWKGLGSVVEMSRDEFKTWLKDGDTAKPAGNRSKIEDPGGAGPIENFGEELQGGRTQRPPSLDQELSDDDIAKQPLSKIWPKAEVDKIEDKFTAALATVIRDIIPNKPRKSYALKRWVEKVKFARTIADLLIGKVGRDQVVQKMQEWSRENGARGLDNFAAKIALLDGIDRSQWSRIGDVAEYPNSYRLDDDGVKTPSPFTSIEIDGRRELFRGAKSVADVIEDVQQKLAGREDVSGRIKFEIRLDQSKDEIFINKAGDSEYRRLKTFAEVEDARKFIANNYEDLVAAWEKVKARDNVKKVDVRNAKNRPRTAKDHRGGKDATEQMFTDAFGFRGVEFGKWVSQGKGAKERQGLINEVYDALLDLSEITGFPPRAMSLGGTLGLALGSRGRGAASAHFEPGNLVINLTKTKGAGSLAHEWFHALDNYFARQRGGERSVSRQDNFITYRPERLYVHKTERSTPTPLARIKAFYEKNPNAGYMNPDNWKPDPSHPQGVRPEVEERFAALVDALNESPMKARSEMNDKGEDGYWGRIIERGARSFENFVISKMMENGYQNDFLANVRGIDDFPRAKSRYPYLLPEEVAPISEAFDALFDVIQTREENGKTVLFQRSAADGMPPRSVQAVVNRMSAQWENAPSIRVIASMSEAPEAVRLEDAKQKRGGATGDPAGFWHQGTVYVVASGQASPQTVARTVLHEVKGHAGLRGAFPNLQPVLQRIIDTRSDQVRAKATQYGLDMSDANQAFTAAEEVLAEMAETNPRNGLVKRAIAAIKQFLRKIGVLDSGSISNEEIVREYLAPAARFVEGRDSGGMVGVPAFQRAESPPPIFYSATKQAIEDGKGAPKRAGAESWKGWLDGAVRRGDMKQSERDWLGVDQWLDQQQGPVTREALAEFVRANEVQVDEVALGQSADFNRRWQEVLDKYAQPIEEADRRMKSADAELRKEATREFRRLTEERTAELDALGEFAPKTKYGSYRIPGGDNYRELLLTLPIDAGQIDGLTVDGVAQALGYGGWTSSLTPEQVAHVNRVFGAQKNRPNTGNEKRPETYRSAHWDQPNVLAHVRFDERTDADGKRVLFLNEIQSDWHQAGRKKGYRADGKDRLNDLTNAMYGVPFDGATPAQQEWARRTQAENALDGVPDAPLKKTDEWAMLAFKRMARWAVDNGFDRIAWVTGEQAADLFDLSKQVRSIEWQGYDSRGATKMVTIEPKSGNAIELPIDDSGVVVSRAGTQFDGKNIADVVGKDIGELIMSERSGSRSGDGLKIGGEGMRGFYDKILPAAVGKWAKKFGAKPQGNAIDITPKMRDAVSEGQTLFQRSADTIEVDGTQRPRTNSNGKPIAQTDEALQNFWRWFGDSKVVDEQGRPMVVYHGTAEVKRIAPRRIQPNKAKREAREQAIDRLSALGREHGITEWASVASVFERWINFGMAEERGVTPEIAAEARRLMDANYAGQPRWTEGRTELGFSAFDMPGDGHELGAHFGTKQQANAFGNAFPFYLSIQSPARLPDLGTWNYQSVIRDLRKRGVEISEADYDAVFNAADNNDALRELLASKGVDGVVYKNMAEGKGDSYITFRPEQIKSATGNHTFDPANPDIRFRRNQAQPDERTSVRKLWDGFLDRFVDEFTSLTQAERATEAAGITLTDKEKARRAENLRHGKFQEKVRQARRDYFEPIAKILGDAKLDREGLADYLWWRHAPERDAVLRAKHKGNPDPDALAGISPKEAQANIDALPQAERQAYEQAAALIDKLRAKTLQVLQDSGQVAPETVDALKSAYQFYVPLRGLPEGSDPELNTASKLYGVGKGLSVNQNPLGKKALGRKSKPSDIIEEMKSDLERALIGAEKQKVLRRVINLMAANPEIGSIDAVEHVKQEVNGLIQYVPKTITENTVTFLHKGKPVRLKMANPRLERALLNINETPVAAIQKLAKVTRWLSAVKTSLSPYFMLINPVRDGLFAGMGIGSEKGIKHLASFGKHYGAAWRAMYRDERNKLKYSAIDTYAKEFGRAGGKTGYTYANSIEDISSELNRLFTQYRKGDGPKGVATRIWYKAEDMIKAANNIAENATRLAVFASMRDNGASVEEAAQYAKEVTVNFNVRGAWGKNLNAAYMFFNASVQGSRRMMTLMKSPAFAGTMVGLGLASYAIALKQMFDAGDDEDGESKYLKQIRDWDSQRAIPLRLGDEEYASIPVPYGPNVFSYLGWKAAELHYKVATGKDPGIADATADVATNLSNSMSPIQVDAGYWNAVPEVARIFLQPFAANINDFGNTISYAEKYAQPGDNTPAYQDADYRTGELFKLMSQFASVATGGDEYEGGAVNIAPEKLRYITQQGLGGMYRLINESMELGQKMMDDSPIEPRDVPLSNVYLRSRDLNNQQSETFYQNRDEVTELRRIYKAAVEREDEDRIEAMLEENPWLDGSELSGNSRLGKKLQAGTPVGELRNAEREIRELRRERQDAYTGLGEYEGMVRRDRMKRVREIDREIANAQRYFNASMNDRSPSQSLPAVQ